MPPRNSESSGSISLKKYTIPLTIVYVLLALCSLIQGIVAISLGSLFNSFSLSTFGMSSIGQVIIILYIYHKLITEHRMKMLQSAATESTPILRSTGNLDSRRKVEKRIAIFGMFIFILLAGITLVSLHYVNKMQDNPDEPKKPHDDKGDGDGDGDDDKNKSRKSILYILSFSVYAIHPYFILIPATWYLSTSTKSLVWREATIWTVLFFLMAYIQFINSQLLYFVDWKMREIVCTIIMDVLFLIYSIRLFWLYMWKGGAFENEIRYTPLEE